MSILINLVFLITGCIGIITTLILGLKSKTNTMVNKYIIISYGLSGIRFLLQGISSFLTNQTLTNTLSFSHVAILIIMPCIYLYFKDLVIEKESEKGYKNLVHLIAPLLLFAIHILKIYTDTIFYFEINLFFFTLLFVTFLFYVYLGFKLLQKQIWKWKATMPIGKKQNKLIRNWTLFLFTGALIILIKGGTTIYSNDFTSGANVNFLFISSIVWLIFFIGTLMTPQILYGYEFVSIKPEEIKKNEIVLKSNWELNNNPEIVNAKDLKTKEIVTKHLENYIHQIEVLSLSNTFRKQGLTQEDLAKKINVPSSHISYLFKYHSSISFSDYKKTIRIKDAIRLIKSDYLQTNTMDSLSKEIGFSSYTPFYNSFKSVMGIAPHEYYRDLETISDKGIHSD